MFGINLPIIRTVFAILLIYAGISLISGIKPINHKKTTVFDKVRITPDHGDIRYSLVFSQGTIDLSNLSASEPSTIAINVTFSAAEIVLNPAIPTKISVKTAFSSAHLPNEDIISFGTYTYSTHPNTKAVLEITLNAVFSSVKIHSEL